MHGTRKSILKWSMSKFSNVLWKCTNSFSRWKIWQWILRCRHAPSVKSWTTSCCSINSLCEEKYGISEDNLPAFATSLTEGGLGYFITYQNFCQSGKQWISLPLWGRWQKPYKSSDNCKKVWEQRKNISCNEVTAVFDGGSVAARKFPLPYPTSGKRPHWYIILY